MAANKNAPKLEPHPLVEALHPDPTKPPAKTLKLVGLPGRSPAEGQTRLWTDSGLTSYVDIPDDAILHAKTLPDDAGTVVWVAADAQLAHGAMTSHETQASFLGGGVTASHLAGAAQAAAGLAGHVKMTPPFTVLPSACGPCVSRVGPCFTLPFCRSEAMAPSHCAPCLTQIWVCEPPSHAWPCHVSQVGPCMSWRVECAPSQQVICPTPTAVQSWGVPCPPPHVSVPCPTGAACPSEGPCPSLVCGGGFGGAGPGPGA
jgi:hypothetical protein